MMHSGLRPAHLFIALLSCFAAGCIQTGPQLVPVAATVELTRDDGQIERLFHPAGASSPDSVVRETIGRDGRIRSIAIGAVNPRHIEWRDGAGARLAGVDKPRRRVLLILDSVPYDLVAEQYRLGKLSLFDPPACVISPFPVMTDPALSEFFAAGPCDGVESVHFDGTRLVEGYGAYLSASNAPWRRFVQYGLDNSDHASAYLFPGDTFRRELAEAQAALLKTDRPTFAAYFVGTSAIGSKRGRDGHVEALHLVDRFCRQLVIDFGGEIEITLLSDHGHNLRSNRRIDLPRQLERLGFHPARTLAGPADVVIPQFGLVSCAAISSQSPAGVARAAVGLDGVELAFVAERSGERERVRVIGRAGEAIVCKQADAYGYQPLSGDPLQLNPILESLRSAGAADAEGMAADSAWRDATLRHVYPDPLHRVWRAMHGLFRSTPDVLLSLENGCYCGSADLAAWLKMESVHGSLDIHSSCGFVMTTAGPLPGVLRMGSVTGELKRVGGGDWRTE